MSKKDQLVAVIEEKKETYITASHAIAEKPELQNEEYFASKLLTELLAKEGFQITKGAAGHETGFVAQKGEGNPKIVFLAEYDALPEIGHGCGHNLIGAQSALAAVATAKVIDTGSVYVYGTPAEEGGDNGSAKASFADQGYFDHIDAAMMIHPGTRNTITTSSLAVHCYDFEFFGQTAHASGCPEEGKNALDAMILFFNGISALRQQTTLDTRIHGIITHGGTAPNVIPAYTKAKFFIRANTISHCDYVLEQVKQIAQGAALMTGCTVAYKKFNNTVKDMVLTPPLDDLFAEKGKELGIQFESGVKKGKGSTDVGNVSHVVPTIQPSIAVTTQAIPGHTVAFRDACIAKGGDQALVAGAKILGLTALELFENPDKLAKIKKAHRQNVKEEA
ncbi:MAG: M20 family metallopeptidase [Clostridiales bacterium]|nr:M20 family metallopeptidase [Clostridiales bacterium]